MKTPRRVLLSSLLGCALFAPVAPTLAAPTGAVHRVLLISVDGLHALDLANYVAKHPDSTLAHLSASGVTYTQASCSKPSDSFPGLMAIITGGTPNSTGIWYDDAYDRALLPSLANGGGSTPGTEVLYDETIDLDSTSINGGGGIDTNKLPRDANGHFVYPHNYLRVNTIFEVIKAAHLRTAWADKHLSYEIVNGPSGTGVDDLFTPEIAAPIVPLGGGDPTIPTNALAAVEAYDDVKVGAIVNEIDGKDHAGTPGAGVPAIFGMNFQAVSVAQKLLTDGITGAPGGYLDGSGTPGPLLGDALDYVNDRLGRMVNELTAQGLLNSTAIIVTAKHGQAPIDVANRVGIKGGKIDSALGVGLAQRTSDDVALLWLNNSADTETGVANLRASASTLGIEELLSGESLKLLFNDPATDSRVPDIIVIPRLGVIYTGGTKIAEHGGFSRQDTNVALLISRPGIPAATIKTPVQTTQIAPTILGLLGLNYRNLQAVQKENTTFLPGILPVIH